MQTTIIFAIITYRPKPAQLNKLLGVLKPYKTLVIDNTKNNLGYAGGANKAIKYALKNNFDWIIILNQDLNLTKNAIKKFVSLLTKTKPGVAGLFLGTLDEKRWTTILPTTPSCHSRESGNLYNKNLYRSPIRSGMTRYISGSFIAIHKKVIEEIGNFYQPYFIYYEDADYCVRAQKAGFPLNYVKISGISHQDATSLGQNSFLHEYYLARNHLLFVKRNAPLSVKLHEILRLPKTIFEHLINRNSGALTGIKDYLLGRFGQ